MTGHRTGLPAPPITIRNRTSDAQGPPDPRPHSPCACAKGAFHSKPLADWDWDWPTALDRPALERILSLDFLARGENVVILGAQGLGKTMLAKNIAHQAVLAGHSALFTTAADLLLDLNGQETARALERRLRHYTRSALLCVD